MFDFFCRMRAVLALNQIGGVSRQAQDSTQGGHCPSAAVVLHPRHTRTTRLACKTCFGCTERLCNLWQPLQRPLGVALWNLVVTASCRCSTQCHRCIFGSPGYRSVLLVGWAQVMMPCEGHTSRRRMHSIVGRRYSRQSLVRFAIVNA